MKITKAQLKQIIKEELENLNERNPLQEDERAEADAQLRARYKELSDKVLSGQGLTHEENKEYLMIAATLDPYKGANE